jgi:hypothetical protein
VVAEEGKTWWPLLLAGVLWLILGGGCFLAADDSSM